MIYYRNELDEACFQHHMLVKKNYLYFLAEVVRNIISFSLLYPVTKLYLINNFLCIKFN